jgi:hypothetical protein
MKNQTTAQGAKTMTTTTTGAVERALGDLVNTSPFLSVEDYGLDAVAVYAQNIEYTSELLVAEAIVVLQSAGFTISRSVTNGITTAIVRRF